MSQRNIPPRPRTSINPGKIELIPFPPLNSDRKREDHPNENSSKMVSIRTISKDGSHIIKIPSKRNIENKEEREDSGNDNSYSSIRRTTTDQKSSEHTGPDLPLTGF